jgi:16S rRNA (guanine966-N2)-methyltransferase
LRITGGKYRGRKINVSRSFKSRPTTDFAKESLFNILSNYFDFSKVKFLDLFTGTGSIGIEMASRGCINAELVDNDRKVIKDLAEILKELGINGIRPVCSDVFIFIRICKKKYDIIFADPPYDLKQLGELPLTITGSGLLEDGGWFILEHPGRYDFSDNPAFFDTRRYGEAHFSFFRKG